MNLDDFDFEECYEAVVVSNNVESIELFIKVFKYLKNKYAGYTGDNEAEYEFADAVRRVIWAMIPENCYSEYCQLPGLNSVTLSWPIGTGKSPK